MPKKSFEGFESLKCVAGGAETAEEVADLLEAQAVHIREMIAEGVKFDLSDINSGHLGYSTEDPKIGEKHGWDVIEEDENGHVVILTADGEILDEFDREE